MGFDTLTIEQIQGNSTIFYAGLAILVIILAFVFAILALANFKKRSEVYLKREKLFLWYDEQVVGFKVGYIKKTAEEKGIEISCMPKQDLMQVLEDEVSNDLNTSS